jgi:hypothetical protein
MALIYFGTGTAGDGDTLYDAFVKINGIIGVGAGTATYSLKVGNGLEANTTGTNDTATGYFALFNNTTGVGNTANGVSASQLNTIGNYNTATGYGALVSSVSGSNNVANGAYALGSNTASNNTAIGTNALYSSVSVSNNTAVGYNALNGNTLYSNCSGLGANTVITASNQVQLGDSSTTTYVYGTVQNRSDIRDKAEIRDTVLGLDFINELRPVDYKWDMRDDYKSEMPSNEEDIPAWLESVNLSNLTHDGTHTRSRFHHGLIAQEVQDVIEASGVDFGGFQDHNVSGGQDVLSIGYDELIAPMIKAIQELTARINVLEGL